MFHHKFLSCTSSIIHTHLFDIIFLSKMNDLHGFKYFHLMLKIQANSWFQVAITI